MTEQFTSAHRRKRNTLTDEGALGDKGLGDPFVKDVVLSA